MCDHRVSDATPSNKTSVSPPTFPDPDHALFPKVMTANHSELQIRQSWYTSGLAKEGARYDLVLRKQTDCNVNQMDRKSTRKGMK